MKVFLEKKSFFEFRGQRSYELDLLGKSVWDCMKESLNADEGDVSNEEDAVVLYPVYPFLERKTLLSYIEEQEGSYFFAGGYVRRGGKPPQKSRLSSLALGRGLFSLSDLPFFLSLAQEKSALEHLSRGALIEAGARVSFQAVIEAGAIIRCGAQVLGESFVGRDAEIAGDSIIENSKIGAGSVVLSSILKDSSIGTNCTVGPFAYLRAGSEAGDGCRVGDFVEIKNSTLDEGTKAAHLAYIGDATVGKRVNIGCGVVFANFDGRKKHRTIVGDDCFIGSNCNLIAPIEIKDHAFLAAGTTLTQDLEKNDFCIGRARECVKPNRGADYYPKKS